MIHTNTRNGNVLEEKRLPYYLRNARIDARLGHLICLDLNIQDAQKYCKTHGIPYPRKAFDGMRRKGEFNYVRNRFRRSREAFDRNRPEDVQFHLDSARTQLNEFGGSFVERKLLEWALRKHERLYL